MAISGAGPSVIVFVNTNQLVQNILKKIIKQNSLKDFDDVKLLPSSELIKKII